MSQDPSRALRRLPSARGSLPDEQNPVIDDPAVKIRRAIAALLAQLKLQRVHGQSVDLFAETVISRSKNKVVDDEILQSFLAVLKKNCRNSVHIDKFYDFMHKKDPLETNKLVHLLYLISNDASVLNKLELTLSKKTASAVTSLDKSTTELSSSKSFSKKNIDYYRDNFNIPAVSSWIDSRVVRLEKEFCSFYDERIGFNEADEAALKNLPLEEQQLVCIQDILFALQNVPPRFFMLKKLTTTTPTNKDIVKYGGHFLSVSNAYAKPIHAILEQLLPVFTFVYDICDFLKKKNNLENVSRTHMAFFGGVQIIFDKYNEFVTDLQNMYSFSVIVIHCQHMRSDLEPLSRLCKSADMLTPAQLINYLHEKLNSSLCANSSNYNMYEILLRESVRPFMEILSFWLKDGSLVDPYKEFMVYSDNFNILSADSEKSNVHNHFYKVDNKKTPNFLSQFSDKILDVGQCLSLLKHNTSAATLKKNPFTSEQTIVFDTKTKKYEQQITQVYSDVSGMFIESLFDHYNFYSFLETIKKLLLFEQGDYCTFFIDLARDELKKDLNQSTNEVRLNNLIDLAISMSSANNYAFKENIHCELGVMTLSNQLKQILQHSIDEENNNNNNNTNNNSNSSDEVNLLLDKVSISINVPWPLNLVVTENSLIKLKMLTRYLFRIKFVERAIYEKYHENVKQTKVKKNSTKYKTIMLMSNFVSNLQNYLVYHVVETEWKSLVSNVNKDVLNSFETAKTVIESFFSKLLSGFMLTEWRLYCKTKQLLDACLAFCNEDSADGGAFVGALKEYTQLLKVSTHTSSEHAMSQLARQLDLTII